jgi:hypothetical protein
MMNNYAVITQDELEPEIRDNPGLAMAPHNLGGASLPNSVKKNFKQMPIFPGLTVVENKPGWTSSYFRKDGTLVAGHAKGKTNKTKGDKKPVKKTPPQPKHGAKPEVKADCKMCREKIRELLEQDGFVMAK